MDGPEFYVKNKKMKVNSMASENVEITVAEVKHVPGGFLTFAYFEYEIETSPFQWKVTR